MSNADKICRTCKIASSLDNFCKVSKYKDSLNTECRKCQAIRSAAFYIKNKEKIDARNKKYWIENKEKVRASNRKYREANKEYLNKLTNDWGKRNRKRRQSQWNEKYNNDPKFRIRDLTRNRFREWFGAKGVHKNAHVVDLIGCSYEQLVAHFESLFKPGMNWDNHGRHGWHIDHIRPLSSFDPQDPEQLKAAWHYTNLQPLWAEENLSKGAKILDAADEDPAIIDVKEPTE